jgi:hypothetical protein
MPSSSNRHRLEIPTALYGRLEGEAQRRQMTAAALATVLLAEALDRAGRERGAHEGEVIGEVRDALKQLLEGDARQAAELRALREELGRTLPQVRQIEMTRSPVSRVAELARTFDSQDWTELRVTGQGAHRQVKPFQDLLQGSSLPPAMVEYLRLLMISDLAQSPELRAEYLRQAQALRDQMAVLTVDRSGKDDQATEREDGS